MWELLLHKYKCISHLASNRHWAKWKGWPFCGKGEDFKGQMPKFCWLAPRNVAGNIILLLFHIIHYKIKLVGIYFQLLLLLHSARDAY